MRPRPRRSTRPRTWCARGARCSRLLSHLSRRRHEPDRLEAQGPRRGGHHGRVGATLIPHGTGAIDWGGIAEGKAVEWLVEGFRERLRELSSYGAGGTT